MEEGRGKMEREKKWRQGADGGREFKIVGERERSKEKREGVKKRREKKKKKQMDSQKQDGIQKLLQAEQEANAIVTAARQGWCWFVFFLVLSGLFFSFVPRARALFVSVFFSDGPRQLNKQVNPHDAAYPIL